MDTEIKMGTSLHREKNWQLLSSKLIHKSPYALVYSDHVQLPDGTSIHYTRVDERSFAVVVPTISDRLVMIHNYRYPLNEWCLELPSGHIEPGESPQEAAFRELEEETGYVAGELRQIGEFCPSVRSVQKAYVFIAEVLQKRTLCRDKSELQRVVVLPIAEVYSKLSMSEIRHAASIVALAFSQPFLCKNGR